MSKCIQHEWIRSNVLVPDGTFLECCTKLAVEHLEHTMHMKVHAASGSQPATPVKSQNAHAGCNGARGCGSGLGYVSMFQWVSSQLISL